MEGNARTWFTPKQKAELWERWKSGQWVADVARGGGNVTRNGQIEILNPSLHPIGAVDLFDPLPLSFPPYVTSQAARTITLDLGYFRFP